jgi:hypothetical protein
MTSLARMATLLTRLFSREVPARSVPLVAVSARQCDWNLSSAERRLAVAGVGLVPSPVGLGRNGIAIETARDEEFLCRADEVAFTEEVGGGAGCWVQVTHQLEHLCSVQPDEGGRRRCTCLDLP